MLSVVVAKHPYLPLSGVYSSSTHPPRSTDRRIRMVCRHIHLRHGNRPLPQRLDHLHPPHLPQLELEGDLPRNLRHLRHHRPNQSQPNPPPNRTLRTKLRHLAHHPLHRRNRSNLPPNDPPSPTILHQNPDPHYHAHIQTPITHHNQNLT